ncbi:hypothetical protein B0H65DRAFT_429809, partial [Neurospora tetraspora]
FDNALRIYPTNTIVNEHNLHHLEELQSPIFIIKFTNILPNAKNVKYTNTSNLHTKFTYIKGNRIILTENL